MDTSGFSKGKTKNLVSSPRKITSNLIKANSPTKKLLLLKTESNSQNWGLPALPKTGASCGIDLGFKDFATISNGAIYKNPKCFRTLEEKLAKEQRILSRRKSRSKNWHEQRVKVAKIHERIANTRRDHLHKISTDIVKSHDIIGIENH